MIRSVCHVLVALISTAVSESVTFVKQMGETILRRLYVPDFRVCRERVRAHCGSDLALISTTPRSSLSLRSCLFDHLIHRLIDSLLHAFSDVLREGLELGRDRIGQLIDLDVRHREPPP